MDNCLKCENFWKSDIDERKCDKCGCGKVEEKGEKENG